ncbi:acyl-ACP--UDP-N-acetylglucosamine O-acyltransferase [Oricola cellulosilytica]|uniref:Acyl-[acyl-carrier-protein]--UDP-N-acetylglucosamine O-acyltransferase n=1 Tax=Oricola cellulosilytica TaxID=1429082 RepID=A0A4V2MNK7_9HYPH|nr:acyl-ACP--UDP-N-acetylglucosamine O-acyltransferase [Oricola cellulosilytica]TCD13206.1 acyl-ACP--UDP-N-acetylglucosamine O-acyltransferase [Oricola cellulosilytica]
MDSTSIPDIHPTALVERGAEIGNNVRIGPFCHIGPHVVIGDNCELMSHVVITGGTTIGAGTRIFPHAVLGTEPQNTAYKGEKTKLVVGRKNTIREGVTMHTGTANARGETLVGDECMFLAYSHVAHDSVLGNHVTFANNVMIGGHTTIGDYVIIGGGAGIHQFCTVGHHAFIGGIAAVVNDVIPYGMVVGSRAYLAGLNLVGMKRSGMTRQDMNALRHAYKDLFAESGGTLRENATRILENYADNAPVCDLARFVLADSKRKFITPLTNRRARQEDGI